MKLIEEKMKNLISEKEQILHEMNEIRKAFDLRQQRVVEINGSLQSFKEVLNDLNKTEPVETETEIKRDE